MIELFTLAKKAGVHTTLDTCGQPFTQAEPGFSKIRRLIEVTDLVLLDIKQIDNEKHKLLTGHPNTNILAFARYLDSIHKPVWIRHVTIPGINDSDQELERLDQFLQERKNIQRVDVLPYHTMGMYKWEALGLEYPLKDVPTPTVEQVNRVKTLLHVEDYPLT